jgi:hypothetical protein
LAHNAAILLIGRKIMLHDEERQGKDVYTSNRKEAAGSSE